VCAHEPLAAGALGLGGAGCWSDWGLGRQGRAGGLAEFRPIRLGNIENLLFFSKSFINFNSIFEFKPNLNFDDS
jgi:hypothetical protein